MILYTMGFAQKNAERFFTLLQDNRVELLIDIRLNNKSQLAGFTKGNDLAYFLKRLCNCAYMHCVEFAPTKEILDAYKKNEISWEQYVERFLPLMDKRHAVERFLSLATGYDRVCLLCSEPTPEQCHRRLLAEMIAKNAPDITVVHL